MRHISDLLDFPGGDEGQRFEPTLLEDPIEEAMARGIRPWVRHPDRWGIQHETLTPWGVFRLDFILILRDGLRVGIDCEVRRSESEFHDRCRDALLLWTRAVDHVFRFSRLDLFVAPVELFALAIAAKHHLFPSAMVERIIPFTKTMEIWDDGGETIYGRLSNGQWRSHLEVGWRSRSPACASSAWMEEFHQFAWSLSGRSLGQVVHAYRNRDRAVGGSR